MDGVSFEDEQELRELLGAYALDAVDADERERVERYLEENPHARAEVGEFRELAALLAHAGTDAPVGVWDRISETINRDRGAPPVARIMPRTERRSRGRTVALRVAVALAAAAAIAAVVLGVKVAQQSNRIDTLTRAAGQTNALRHAMDVARSQQGARSVVLSAPDGTHRAQIVYLPDGTGFLSATGLATLPDGRTYQLWALVGDAQHPTAISAGVLGAAPGVAAFRYRGPVVGFALTDERAPGVVSSTNQPVAAGHVD